MVIGVGAIGKQVATLLVSMGAPRVSLVDPDVVAVENLNVQGYYPSQLTLPKVHALARVAKEHNPEVEIEVHHRNYGGDIDPCMGKDLPDIAVFSCVDSIDARTFIWNTLQASPKARNLSLFVDGRMAAETLQVYTWKKGMDRKTYDDTLYPAAEAYQASCTGRSTLHGSYVVAGLMVAEFTKWLRNHPLNKKQVFNLLASEHEVCD